MVHYWHCPARVQPDPHSELSDAGAPRFPLQRDRGVFQHIIIVGEFGIYREDRPRTQVTVWITERGVRFPHQTGGLNIHLNA